MLSLDQKNLQLADVAENVIFICRPLVNLMPLIASAIRGESNAGMMPMPIAFNSDFTNAY